MTGTSSRGSSIVDFHRGEVLWALANTYPSLMLALVENAQNGIDAEATAIFIGIDLANRTVTVADNGVGVTKEQFEEALASVGRTVKSRDKLGRFGRGLIAPLNKCARFSFTSRPAGSRTLSWTFVGDDIRKQHQTLTIPLRQVDRLPELSRRFKAHATDRFSADWRTMVNLRNITKDRVVSLVDLEELESQIRQKLGARMRERGVSIRVVLIDQTGREQRRDINAIGYSGEPLEVVTYHDAVAGDVEFELYRARKLAGARRGEVVVSELGDSYGVPLKDFINQARGGGWREILDPVFNALSSGYFEGVIRCKNITLHPERTKFEYDDTLHSLYLVLSQWFEECGKSYFDDEQVVTREARWQDLGLQSQQRLREVLMSRPDYQRLWDGLKAVVRVGRLGKGHLDPEHGRPDGIEDDPTLRTGQGGAGKGSSGGGGASGGERQREPKDRPGDMPTGVSGPRGQRRQLVRGDSQGLWFEYSWFEGNSHLWEFDFDKGILTFNVRHPVWIQLDENAAGKHTKKQDRWIMSLQEWLALEVLTLLTRYATVDELDLHREILDSKVRPYVDLFIISGH